VLFTVQGEGDGEIYEVSVKVCTCWRMSFLYISDQPCVEVTFLTIFSQFQDTVKPVVMEMLHKVQGITKTSYSYNYNCACACTHSHKHTMHRGILKNESH